jgi:hypothetical protein
MTLAYGDRSGIFLRPLQIQNHAGQKQNPTCHFGFRDTVSTTVFLGDQQTHQDVNNPVGVICSSWNLQLFSCPYLVRPRPFSCFENDPSARSSGRPTPLATSLHETRLDCVKNTFDAIERLITHLPLFWLRCTSSIANFCCPWKIAGLAATTSMFAARRHHTTSALVDRSDAVRYVS